MTVELMKAMAEQEIHSEEIIYRRRETLPLTRVMLIVVQLVSDGGSRLFHRQRHQAFLQRCIWIDILYFKSFRQVTAVDLEVLTDDGTNQTSSGLVLAAISVNRASSNMSWTEISKLSLRGRDQLNPRFQIDPVTGSRVDTYYQGWSYGPVDSDCRSSVDAQIHGKSCSMAMAQGGPRSARKTGPGRGGRAEVYV